MSFRATRYRINFVEENIRKSAMKSGMVIDTDNAKTFDSRRTDMSKPGLFEKMSVSSAFGEATSTYEPLCQGCTDGKYIYYSDLRSNYNARYDTNQAWTSSSAWEKINSSSAAGGAMAAVKSYIGSSFDGRYVYFAPFSSSSFTRYDTSLAFTHSSSWSNMCASTAMVADSGISTLFKGSLFDGRYVYYFPYQARTVMRYDTTSSFTNSSAWEKMGLSHLNGADPGATGYTPTRGVFDGQYVYMGPYLTDTFWRYNTSSTFTHSGAWSKMYLSAILGATNTLSNLYGVGMGFDGRYVYYAPYAGNTFIRYDITQSFTSSSSYQKFTFGAAAGAGGAVFDGRYMYFWPEGYDTMYRYDTVSAFTETASWGSVNISTALGYGPDTYGQWQHATYDGKYIYFGPFHSDTLVRIQATKSDIQYTTTF